MTNYTYGDTLLTIDKVNLSYGNKPILRDISVSVKDIIRTETTGQVIGFLGPSGIGKSSLLRIMAGLEQPTSGQVTLNGSGLPVRAGEVGVVFQNYPMFNHRTVYSNLLLAASRKYGKDARNRVETCLQQFGLEPQRNHYPSQLSGGQRQRAAISQQILSSGHFVLMDEPFSGLDLVMLEKTAALIQQVANLDSLNTVICVSHDVTTLTSVCDTLWLLGRDRDPQGNFLPGARIQEVYDLAQMDLCWHEGIVTRPDFIEFVAHVKSRFRSL